jgi:hypothetical protein
MWPHCVLTDCIKVEFKGQPEDVRHAMDLFRVRLAGHELKPFFHLLDVYMRDATRSGDRSAYVGFYNFLENLGGQRVIQRQHHGGHRTVANIDLPVLQVLMVCGTLE